jgi:hypothetical protein
MDGEQRDDDTDVQGQIAELYSRLDATEQQASESESRADKAELRADDSATRADAAETRRNVEDVRARDDRRRLTDLEGRVDAHDEMIAELQAEGLITSEQVVHLEAALETARVIGAAVGVIMTLHRISQVEAFRILKKASMDGNRKLRLVAEEVVLTGHAPGLPSR